MNKLRLNVGQFVSFLFPLFGAQFPTYLHTFQVFAATSDNKILFYYCFRDIAKCNRVGFYPAFVFRLNRDLTALSISQLPYWKDVAF